MSLVGTNDSNNYYSVSAAGLGFLAMDWTVGFWCQMNDNAGSSYQQAFGNNYDGATGFAFYLGEHSLASQPDEWRFACGGAGGSATLKMGTATPGSSTWWLILGSWESGMVYLRGIAYRTATVLSANSSVPGFGVMSIGDMQILRRYTTGGKLPLLAGNKVGECFGGQFALTAQERLNLAQGMSPWKLPHTLSFYIPGYEALSTIYDLSTNHYVGTKQGSPLTGSHAPVSIGGPLVMQFPAQGDQGNGNGDSVSQIIRLHWRRLTVIQ